MELEESLIVQLLEYVHLNDSEFVEVINFARDCLQANLDDRVAWRKAYQKANHHINLACDLGYVIVSGPNSRGRLQYRLTWVGHKALRYIEQNGKLPE